MENAHSLRNTKIALLIDFDNVILGVEDPGFDVELVVNALRSRGVVVMGRAYGDWYRHHRHRRKLMEQGIELVETPVFGPLIKNSADIRIVLDGFEIAMSQAHIDTFCLVSGDSDFLPLIKKLQYLGKSVIVIAGNKFTSDLVRRNCNEYIAYENLLAESVGATEDVSVIEGAYQLLERSINTLNERLMDIRSSTVKQMMLQLNPAFSERTFGCNQFKQFLDRAARAGIIKIGERDQASGEFTVLLINETVLNFTPRTTEARDDAKTESGGASRNGANRTEGMSRSGRRFSGRNRRVENVAENGAPAPEAGAEASPEAAPVESSAVQPAAQPLIDPEPAVPPFVNVLAARTNLRKGRLRFSAKSGRVEPLPKLAAAPTPALESEQKLDPADATASVEALHALVAEEIAAAKASGETAEAGTPEQPALDLEEAKPARKRGTRGGRRRKPAAGAEAAGAEAVGAEESVEAAVEAEAPAAVVDTRETVTRTRAPRKAASKPASKKTEEKTAEALAAPAPSEAAAAEPAEGEEATKKRATRSRGGTRRTSARKPKEAGEAAADSAEQA